MITFDNVNKYYGDYHALSDINEHVAKGEVLVVCGPSGSGKSTLIRTINRLEPIASGRITVAGQDIHAPGLDVNAFRSHIGFVFQQFNLFPHLSVLDNCALAPQRLRGLTRRAAEERAQALLERVGLAHKARAMPAALSGGQQQRVAIARALAMQPSVMLLDEPTSALDPELAQEVVAVIRQLADDGITLMMATHEMSLARDFADRVLFMVNGQIVEDTMPARRFFQGPASERGRQFLSHHLAGH